VNPNVHLSPWLTLRRTERHGIVLLLATVLLLLIMPWAEPYPLVGALVALLFLLAIAAGVGVGLGRGGRRIVWLTAPLTVGWLAARILSLAVPFGNGTGLRLAPMLGLALILLVLVNILRSLVVARRISAEVLAEAFTGYLLIAIAFALLFELLDELLSGAFSTAAPPVADTAFFTYFSLVTLASIGYGDIVPTHPFVRIVAALEGVCGLFYGAVVVARLVSAYTPRETPSPVEPGLDGAGDRGSR
jgi:ion channel